MKQLIVPVATIVAIIVFFLVLFTLDHYEFSRDGVQTVQSERSVTKRKPLVSASETRIATKEKPTVETKPDKTNAVESKSVAETKPAQVKPGETKNPVTEIAQAPSQKGPGENGVTVNLSVDDKTIGRNKDNTIYVKDGGLSENKLDPTAKAKLNSRVEIGNITVTGGNYVYLATDYLNADGNVSGKENTVAEWQAMINACAVTGGTIFFPDGHYVCKPAAGETNYLLFKDKVAFKGSSTIGTTIELKSSAEFHFFRFQTNATAEISDMTVIHNFLNEYIEPLNSNLGKRITFYIGLPNINLTMNNLHIKAINLNNGYNIEIDNFRESSAAYMVLDVCNNNCRVIANNCYAESPAWGIFNISKNSDLIWYGDLRCWFKCTGAHGTGSRIIVHGNLTSYGSGSYSCISCSGGTTIVDGNLYRVPEVDAPYSLYGSAIYAGIDDEPTIIVNGNIFTCSGVYQGSRGVCEINGNIYCIDKDFSREINRILFAVNEYVVDNQTCFADVKFTGNISCMGNKPFGLFHVKGGHLEVNGNSFTCFASVMNAKESGSVKLTGIHQVVKDRFIRMFAGKLSINGQYTYSANHEMIQVVGPDKPDTGVKIIDINNAEITKPEHDYDRIGNIITTETGTGQALLNIFSDLDEDTKITVTNVKTNGVFSEGVAAVVEIYNCVASKLGTVTKNNTLNDL